MPIDTIPLHDRDLGGLGKPPLVILHGLLGSSRNWQTAGAELSQYARVHALDLRNHGRTPHAPAMDYDTMVADVFSWLDAHNLQRVALMGHSMGGKVAMALACRHPERVEKLIIVDIAPKDYLSHAHRVEFAAMNELDLRTLGSRAEAEMRFESRVSDWAMRKFLATNLERDPATNAWRWVINLPVLTSALPGLEANPLSEDGKYEGSVLFVAGGKSNYISAPDHESIRRHFPNAQIKTITGAGHNPHMETRAEFVQLVAEALKG